MLIIANTNLPVAKSCQLIAYIDGVSILYIEVLERKNNTRSFRIRFEADLLATDAITK